MKFLTTLPTAASALLLLLGGASSAVVGSPVTPRGELETVCQFANEADYRGCNLDGTYTACSNWVPTVYSCTGGCKFDFDESAYDLFDATRCDDGVPIPNPTQIYDYMSDPDPTWK